MEKLKNDKEQFLSTITNIKKNKYGEYIAEENGILTGFWQGKYGFDYLVEYEKEHPEEISDYIEEIYVPIEEKAEEVRAKRDYLLTQADILQLKYQEQVELGIINADDDYRLSLLQYKENLRNVPEQEGFPENVVWPELPARA